MTALFSLATRLLVLTLLSVSTLHAAKPLNIQAIDNAGQSHPGFLMKADATGLVIAATENGGSSITLPYAQIQSLNVEEPRGWTQAQTALDAGNYPEAKIAFDKLANEYIDLLPWKDGYGSLARLNYFKALKGLNQLTELAAAMDRQLAQPLVLSDYYQADFNDLKGWAILGKDDILALEAFLLEFQEDVQSRESLLPLFKPAPARLIASLHYLRAMFELKQQKPDLALIDFQSAMTYDFGSDPAIFGMSLKESLAIVATKLQTKPDDLTLKRLAHSLAVTYRDIVGGGTVPEPYVAYLPPVTDPAAAKEEEKEEK
ncbi:MAG: hypothetical protein KDK99_04325 [Verrucomicrobiales bacterium]|nr:hypothetical protein [Verrucomicrobiales bacterium]